jgi:hypothetical protein
MSALCQAKNLDSEVLLPSKIEVPAVNLPPHSSITKYLNDR